MAELVFLHGAGDSATVWDKQVERFGSEHRVLAPDLPGHGQRLGEQAFDSHADNAGEVARLIQAAALSRPILIGHSMGGAVALSVALEKPRLPRALVLVASGARLRMHPDFLETARRKAEASPPGQVAGSAVPLEMVVSPRASAETRAWLSRHVGQSAAQAAYADFLANNAFDVMERLQEITQPALVLAGEDDRMTPPKFQTFLAERLPHSRLVLLPGVGHYVQIEGEMAFNQELERFLAALEP